MTITGHQNLLSLSSYIHEEDFDKVQQKLNNGIEQTTKPQNTDSNLEKELQIMRLKLQLAEKEKENLQMQLQIQNHEVQRVELDTDHQKGYV